VRNAFALGITLALTFGAYANASRGQFVYDDTKQILQNHLIKHPSHYWEALTSDVWAFKGIVRDARSNYWRPTFTALNIACYSAFGENPTGWHVVNIVLHALVCILGYLVLQALGVRWVVATAVTWLFAAHPVHVESVTWIAGSPDMLLAIGLFGSYLCYLQARIRPKVLNILGLVAFYAFAQFSKEGAIVYPVLLLLSEAAIRLREFALPRATPSRDSVGAPPSATVVGSQRRPDGVATVPYAAMPTIGKSRIEGIGTTFDRQGLGLTLLVTVLPTLAFAAVFMALRYWVLGFFRIPLPWAPKASEVVLTAPTLLAFYLKQVLLPLSLSPQYGLRTLTGADFNLVNAVIPTVVVFLVLVGFGFLAWRRRVYRFGLIWLLLPIALALDIRSFRPEELVHDRYLYLPLFGALLLLCQAAHDLLVRLRRAAGDRAAGPLLPIAGAASVLLAILTFTYNPVWGDERRLWSRAVEVDPNSAHAWMQLANAAYQEDKDKGDLSAAKQAYEKALAIKPDATNAHVGLGLIAKHEHRFADAEKYFRIVLSSWPDDIETRENLGETLQKQNRIDEAIRLFEEGKPLSPFHAADFDVNIAVLLASAGRFADATARLEAIRPAMTESVKPNVLLGWFHLARLYAQANRPQDSAAALQTYLRLTESLAGQKEVQVVRAQAGQALKNLTQGKPPGR